MFVVKLVGMDIFVDIVVLSFEDVLCLLEEVVCWLESGEVLFDDLIMFYECGEVLCKYC